MDFTVRKAAEGDHILIRPLQKEIADLHHAGRPDLFRVEARYYSEEAFSERLAEPNQVIFIAESDDGTVVGYAFAWVIEYQNHPTYKNFSSFYIDDICVLSAFRRNGIGRKLFEKCKTEAINRGCKNIDLGVWAFNSEAIAFYKSCGMSERVIRMELPIDR